MSTVNILLFSQPKIALKLFQLDPTLMKLWFPSSYKRFLHLHSKKISQKIQSNTSQTILKKIILKIEEHSNIKYDLPNFCILLLSNKPLLSLMFLNMKFRLEIIYKIHMPKAVDIYVL